jgi:hypothetical protein
MYSKASTMSPDPMGGCWTPGYTVQTSRLVQDPYVYGPNPLEWDPTPPPPGGGGGGPPGGGPARS